MLLFPLGSSGLSTTEFVFGAAAGAITGGDRLGDQVKRVDEAWDVGIRSIEAENLTVSRRSEAAVGAWLGDSQPDDALIATTVGGIAEVGQRIIDLSAAHIDRQLTTSLRTLGRIDLYLVEGADERTPIEETLVMLASAIDAGQIRSYGWSELDVWQLEAILSAADKAGLPRPIAVQNPFSLLDRGDERDLMPLAIGEGIGYIASAPLERGVLSERWIEAQNTLRAERAAEGIEEDDDPLLAQVQSLARHARDFDVSASGLALAWLRQHPSVTATVVAPRASAQWDIVHEALERDLDDSDAEQVAALFR
ncbi:aldo/keto reductase [Naasia lichenicola]|uniref:Aldo/keto reductase n=1 Tax=Naasia lichenicola TaxID=2565933 RepID=A0A4S4FND4_9MICO|nr:aldo/keto reductase [Naasia lichenicola]THG31751.1 aldo/keto reductase [Naasia lichenicola]